MHRYLKTIAGVGTGSYIYYWKSKRLSDERINSFKMPNLQTWVIMVPKQE